MSNMSDDGRGDSHMQDLANVLRRAEQAEQRADTSETSARSERGHTEHWKRQAEMAEERARRAEKMLTIERRLMAIEREYDEIVHLLEQQREQQQHKGWLRVAWPMRYLSHLVGRREPTKSADGGQPSDGGQQADSHSGKRSARKGSLQSGQL